MPTITIITVVLNAEKYIVDTINSVSKQTFLDYEHLIFDGGSKDKTLEYINQHKHSKLKLIQEKDKGIYDAMNKAIKHAQGDWLYFLNAGDLLYNENVLEQIFTNPIHLEADLLSGFVKTMNDPTGISLLSGKELSLSSFYFDIPVSHQGAFIKRYLFDEIGYYHLQYTVVADQEWFVRFFKLNFKKYIFTNEIFAWYETVGFSYNNRIKGLRQMIDYSKVYFPLWVTIINHIRFPYFLLKVKTIQLLKNSFIYKKYRQVRYGRN
ncbi:MAG: glycosyltransferase [Bacteroidetes bacterium]|nr:glycosyltransferase [Bacteroidota bacterium]